MSQSLVSKALVSPSNRLSRPSVLNQNNRKNSPTPAKQQALNDSETTPGYVATNTDHFKIGDRVWVGGVKPGIIAFIGEVQFAQGEWAGVVLDSPVGKNDGSVNGLRYFMCEPKRGIFATLTKLTKTYTKNLSSAMSDAKNQSETKVVDSSDNMSDKSQKSSSSHSKNSKEPSSNTSVEQDGTKFIHSDATSQNMGNNNQSEVSEIKTSQSDCLTSSMQLQYSGASLLKRKTSVGSGSSQSSGKIEGISPLKIHLPFKIGDKVLVSGSKEGMVRFVGEAEFAKGVWVGVELDEAMGKNDGSVAGKRYFHCAPMHGLFAPVHKVDVCRTPTKVTPQHQPRQQKNQLSMTGNAVSKSSSHNSSFTNNRGSQESISSIGSATSSASRRMKLGVTSLSSHTTRSKGSYYNAPTLSALQKTLKEKEEHIEQLIKERDLDRSEFIRTAAQIDEVESQLTLMQSEKKKFMEETECKLRQAEDVMICMEAERNDLKIQLVEERRKYEDLQFSLEEANIEKSDIQSQIEKDSKRLKELDKKLKSEMHLNDKLSNEIKSYKMIGSGNGDPIDEYLDQIEELTHKLCVAENKIKKFEIDDTQAKSVDLCGKCFQDMESDADKECDDVSNNGPHLTSDPKGMKNQLRLVTQEKMFAEAQKLELEEDLKKVSAEKDLIELELNNLVEDHKKLLNERDKLVRERSTNQKLIQETGVQISDFEHKVEKLTSEYAFRMESLKMRADTAESEVQVLKANVQHLSPFKEQVDRLAKQVQSLMRERDSLVCETKNKKMGPTPVEEGGVELHNRSEVISPRKSSNNNECLCDNINKCGVIVGASLIEKLKSEKDFAESQIEFLNAVIVDLQKKNSELENRLKVAESSRSMTDSLLGWMNSNNPRQASTLRLFCDICDVFDQHDTEDCPMQNMTSSPLSASQHHGSKDEERPYCTSCEVFGHLTDQCKDEQTY